MACGIWGGSVADGALAALEQSIREFHGDRTRLYLTGISMGGYGAWTLAVWHPTMFAAQRLAGTPAWLFHGAADSVIPVTESRLIHSAFEKAGSPVRYTEYPGVGHNSWDQAFSDPMLWEWLFVQRRAVPQ